MIVELPAGTDLGTSGWRGSCRVPTNRTHSGQSYTPTLFLELSHGCTDSPITPHGDQSMVEGKHWLPAAKRTC